MDKEHFCNDKCDTCKSFDDKSALGIIDVQNFINIKDYESGKVICSNVCICGWVIITNNDICVGKIVRKCIDELQQINKEGIINWQTYLIPHYILINKDKHSSLKYVLAKDFWHAMDLKQKH